MNAFRFSALVPATLLTAVLVVSAPSPAEAILGFGKNPNRKALSAAELANQEAAASKLFTKAQSLESSGAMGKARDVHEEIVKNYPRTRTAGESQFKVAELRQAEGKSKRAFEEYQEFLENYKNNQRFGDAVQRQFEIADGLMNSEKTGFLGGIGAAIQPSKLIEMFEQISRNAPQTDLSAKAQLAIGKVNRDEGKLTESILAYESVVEEYPNTKFAQEAQFNLFKLHGREADRSFSPVDLRQQQEAGEDFITQFGEDPRANDIKAALGKLEDTESSKSFDIGRFYERKGNLRSAAVYYREVLQHPGSKQFEPAKKRLSALIEADPSLASIGEQVRRRPAADDSVEPITPTAPSPDFGSGDTMAPPAASPPARSAEIPPAPPVKKTADLYGPPPPDVKTARPKMRTSSDDVLPIPTDDPAGN